MYTEIAEPHWAVKEIADQIRRIEPDAARQQVLYEGVRAALM